MNFEPDHFCHVYSRGNNRQQTFFTAQHYLYFIRKIREQIAPHCELLAYCLMPNHFHLLLFATPSSVGAGPVRSQPLIRGIGAAISFYSQGLNKERDNTGSVFQNKTKAKFLLDSVVVHTCFHYIHQTPVRAGLTGTLAEWSYASYRDYAGLRSGTLCNHRRASELLDLPATPADFVRESQLILDPDRVRPAWYL